MSPLTTRVLDLLKRGYATAPQLGERLGSDAHTVRKALRVLHAGGRVAHTDGAGVKGDPVVWFVPGVSCAPLPDAPADSIAESISARTFSLDLSRGLRLSLARHAERLDRTPQQLGADLLERVLTDNLVDAVLDEEARA